MLLLRIHALDIFFDFNRLNRLWHLIIILVGFLRW